MSGRAGVLLAYLRARRRTLPDRAALEEWQAARLREVLDHARLRYPYYRGLDASAQLSDFPVIDKSVVLDHFAELNDRGLELEHCLEIARRAEGSRDFTASSGGVSIGLSSGTSGRQSVFLTSPSERSRWAGEILARVLPGGLWRGARVALVLRAGGPLYESVGSGRVAFQFFDLALPVAEHLAPMAEFAPTVLAGPPSVLRLLAAARADGRLNIAPERVFSVAEVLDPHDERAIEAGLGCRVDQIYQATEGFLGISCALGRLHLNEDLLVVEREPLDAGSQRFTPVVTDLFRTTQSVIRLRLDDVLVADDRPCPCGSPCQVVTAVEGRADDVLLLPRATEGDPGTPQPFYADFVRGAVLGTPGVRDFRVRQTGPGDLHLAVAPDDAFDAAAAALTGAIVAAGLVAPVVVQAALIPTFPPEKLRRVRRDPGSVPAPVGPLAPPR